MHAHDRGVIELDRDPRLVAQPFAVPPVLGELGAQPLDRDPAAEQGVFGQHDLAHAAVAEVGDDAEPTERDPALHRDRPRANGKCVIRDDRGTGLEAVSIREIARPGGQTTVSAHDFVTSGAGQMECARMTRWATPQ